ncbi:MAG: class I SAM-dependent methyltransferase [Acidobacteria bacterium]|nr:class I SAM-dependent methyltransferase [Acidobacteriota bacterium]
MKNTGPKIDPERRLHMGAAFQEGGAHYDKVRPSYPEESARWLIGAGMTTAADVGAGTGKFTKFLVEAGLSVSAVDPSADMLAQLSRKYPQVHTVVGTGEQTSLPPSSVDLVTVAQAWHWMDSQAASTELGRILRPGGRLGLIWNQLDVTVPWVHRLSRIMHAGDVHKDGYSPPLGAEFGGAEQHLTRWEQDLTPEDIVELVKSRSYYLNAQEETRAKVLRNLRWYLYEHLGHTDGELVPLPYVTITWRATNIANRPLAANRPHP